MTLAWQVLITYAALVGLAFIVTYACLAPWWRSAVGWNLMTMAAGLTTAFGLLAVRSWVGSFGRLVWFVAVLLIAGALTHRTYLLVAAHRRDRAPTRTEPLP